MNGQLAVLTTSYPAHPGDPSGHFVESDCRVAARHGAHVTVLAPWPQRGAPGKSRVRPASSPPTDDAGLPPPEPPGSGTVRVRWLPGGELFGWPGMVARATTAPWRLAQLLPFARAAQSALRELQPDAVHAHWIIPSGVIAAFATPPPTLLSVVVHGSDARWLAARPGLARLATETLLRRGARFRFVAEELREVLCSALPAPMRAAVRAASHVAPSAIDLGPVPSRQAARALLGIPEGARLAVVMARLVPSKRVDRAVAAVAPGTRVHVLGDGPLLGTLAREHPRARFFGLLPRPEALVHLAAADELVTASREEGAPSVEREAACLGVPVRRVD